jgi:PAS domain S-box-containing protein
LKRTGIDQSLISVDAKVVMKNRFLSTLTGYFFALAANLAALGLTYALEPIIAPSPFPIFVAVTALSTWFYGVSVGLFSTLLAVAVTNFFFMPPLYILTLGKEDVSRLGVFLLVTAITISWMRTQRVAAEARARLGAIVAFSDDAILGLSPEGNITSWNAGAQRIYGYSAREVLGHSIQVIVSGERQAEMEAILGRIRGGEPTQQHETVHLKKSGQTIDAAITISPIRDKTGEITGASLIARNITDRKQAEKALQESEARFASFMENLPGSAWLKDLRGKYLFANQRVIENAAARFAAVDGKTDAELWPEKMAAQLRENDQMVIASGQAIQTVECNPQEDEPRFWLVTTFPIPFRSGAPEWIGGIGVDITEQKQIEQKLQESTDQLHFLSRRLVEVQENERRLIARELHDEIGQDLTGLQLIMEVLPHLPPETVQEKTGQAQALVKELFERVSRLTLDLRPPMLDDLGLLPTLMWHFNRYTAVTSIGVDFQHSGLEKRRFHPKIETAAYRIIQEALTNVARHTSASRIEVRVDVGAEQLRIGILDNGQGFDFQSTLASGKAGGLVGMRERAEFLGGSLAIESTPGQGARLDVALPVEDPLDAPNAGVS